MKTQILTFQCSFASHASFDSHKLYEVENEIFVLLYREVMRLPCSSNGNESACEAGDQGSIPGLGSSLEKAVAIHSRILAWKPGGLQSMGLQRVGHD